MGCSFVGAALLIVFSVYVLLIRVFLGKINKVFID